MFDDMQFYTAFMSHNLLYRCHTFPPWMSCWKRASWDL